MLEHDATEPAPAPAPAPLVGDVAPPVLGLANRGLGLTGRMPRANSPAAVLWLQRAAGNAAVAQSLLRSPATPPERGSKLARQSAASQLDAAAGVQTARHDLSASVTIAANQTLPSPPGKTIHTADATQVHVDASAYGLTIDFSPYLIITKHDDRWWVPDVDIWVHSARWLFADQMLHVEWTARNIVNWVGDPGSELLSAMQAAISGLPARMLTPGYSPFDDADLPADLASFATRIAGAGGPSDALPTMSNASVVGSFSLAQELSRPAGDGVTIVIPSGAGISVRADLAGIPHTAADLRIARLELSVSDGARIDLRALGQDWPVVTLTSATVTAGHISAAYTIIHESLGTALLELLAAAQVQADPLSAGRIRDDLTFRDQAAHQRIDAMMRSELEPMLRDLVIHNTGAIPGLNLQQALGIENAAAPVP